jgi:hypothetical protein
MISSMNETELVDLDHGRQVPQKANASELRLFTVALEIPAHRRRSWRAKTAPGVVRLPVDANVVTLP